MKEVKVVVRNLRKEISEELMKSYEKEFLELKMKEIKKEKENEEVEKVKKEADEDFLFIYEKMPKKEILRMEIRESSRKCKTITEHQCEICQKYFTAAKGLKNHFRLHFELPKTHNKIFHCSKCNKNFKKELKSHLCISSTCPHCNVTLKNKTYVKTHLRKLHGIKIGDENFFCDYCGCGFSAIGFLKIHFLRGNCRKLKDPYSCDHCNRAFTYKKQLRSHVLVHSKYEIECKVCQIKMRLVSLKTHMRMFHPKTDKNFQCKCCSKTFKSDEAFKRHSETHNKKFQCKKCPRKFSTSASLNFHVKIHNNPEEFQCKVCGQQSVSKVNLKIHMRIHDNNRLKDFKCNRCDYKTDHVASLKGHLKFHERLDKKLKENPNAMKCEKCPAVVTSLTAFKNHMRFKHGNREKFRCDLCKYSTFYKKNLIGHLARKHSK